MNQFRMQSSSIPAISGRLKRNSSGGAVARGVADRLVEDIDYDRRVFGLFIRWPDDRLDRAGANQATRGQRQEMLEPDGGSM